MKNSKLLPLFIFIFLPFQSFSFQGEPKTLNEFKNIETYELYLLNMEQSCLNERQDDLSATGCLIKGSAWKASADYYQGQLEKITKDIDKMAFLEVIDKLAQYESALTNMNEIALEFKYKDNDQGSMFRLMRESDRQELMLTLNKSKALYFKQISNIYADNHYLKSNNILIDELNLSTPEEEKRGHK